MRSLTVSSLLNQVSVATAVGARLIATGFQAALLIVLARTSDLPAFGHFSTLVAIGNILGAVLGFGMATRVLRLHADSLTERTTSYIATSTVSSAAIVLILLGIALEQGRTLEPWAYAAALFAASELLCGVIQSAFFGEMRRRKAEIYLVLRRLVPFAFTSGFLLMDYDVYTGAAVGYSLSTIVGILMLGSREWSGWRTREILTQSMDFWIANIGSLLQQVDLPLVAVGIGPQAAGIFAGAFRLASPVHIVTTSLSSVFVPKLSMERDSKQRINMSNHLLIWGGAYTILVLLLSPIAAFLGPLILGSQFNGYSIVFAIMFINSGLNVMSQMLSSVLYSAHRARPVAICTLLSTIAGLCLVGVGAWIESIVLAAIGTASIQLVLIASLGLIWRSNISKPEGPVCT